MGKIVQGLFAVLAVSIPASIQARAEIVDRVSVVVGTHVIKQSDIDRDIRVVCFLNQAPSDFSPQSRKQSASRLIDQLLIRQDMQATGAAPAALGGMEQLLMQIKKDRFANDMQYRQALAKYGLSEEDLRSALLWQLTVLRFIDQRFGSATGSDDQDIVSGERANQQFENWIERTRKDTRIEYREESLR